MCTHSSNPYQYFSGSWQRHPHESMLPKLAPREATLVREREQSLAPNTQSRFPLLPAVGQWINQHSSAACSLHLSRTTFWQGFHEEDRLLQSNSYIPAFEF